MESTEMAIDEPGNILGVVHRPGRAIGLKFLCCSSEPHSEYSKIICHLLRMSYRRMNSIADNGGVTTSRQDWILTVNVFIEGNPVAFRQQWKVQVVATPGRKTKTNGPVAGSASASVAAANVQVRNKKAVA